MNNAFAHDRSKALANHIQTHSDIDSHEKQIQLLWQLAYSRNATTDEIELSSNYLDAQQKQFSTDKTTKQNTDFLALASLCHAVLNSNEFIYVD